MIIKKNLLFYLLGSAAIVLLSFAGPLRVMGEDGTEISVIEAIMRLSRPTLWESSALSAFSACGTMWVIVFLPIAAAIPSSYYIYGELTSRFHMGVQMRKGKYRYVYSRFLYSAVSGALTVLAGLVLYEAAVTLIFPLNPIDMDIRVGYVEMSWPGYFSETAVQLAYMALYGMAMSLAASFLVFVYPNLYVDLSALFVFSYLLKESIMANNYVIILVLIAFMVPAYGLMWKVRCERL